MNTKTASTQSEIVCGLIGFLLGIALILGLKQLLNIYFTTASSSNHYGRVLFTMAQPKDYNAKKILSNLALYDSTDDSSADENYFFHAT